MGREVYVAYGFQTGHHWVKVNVENKNQSPMPVVIDQVVIYVCYGLRKIMALQEFKLTYFKHLNVMNFVHSGLRRAYLRFCD